ncbi:tetratricopeptide repeat protein [Desulfovulcanus sp.]
MTKKIYLILIIIFLPVVCWAAKEESVPYDQWLLNFKAYDAYVRYLQTKNPTPETIISQAKLLLTLNRSHSTLDILKQFETLPGFDGQRLWLMGKAYRMLGEYDQAISNFVAAAEYFSNAELKELFSQEKELDRLWQDVCTKWFWQNLFVQKKADQAELLNSAVQVARKVWPDQDLWTRFANTLSATDKTLTYYFDEHIPHLLAKALSAQSIKNWSLSSSHLNKITTLKIKNFWTRLEKFIHEPAGSLVEIDLQAVKSSVFFEVYGSQLKKIIANYWFVPNLDLPSWKNFLDQLKNLSPEQGLRLVENELSSSLLSPKIKPALKILLFIYQIQTDRFDQALKTWAILENYKDIPLSLSLSATLIAKNYHPLIPFPEHLYPISKDLLQAAGLGFSSTVTAPFWLETGEKNEKDLLSAYPLDRLLSYLYWKNQLEAQKSYVAAKHLAFLFPETPAGQSGFLSLARAAYKNGHKALAWKYLQNIREEFLDSTKQLDLIEAKAGILMDLGHTQESLKTYTLLLNKAPQRLSAEKRLKLALLAQQSNKWELAENILTNLWQERKNLSPALQAEILFWLGEGSQYQGKTDQALDYYLKLAWQFPEENIWAITAMYRAGQIYEQKGMLEAAKNLYQTVLKKAERKSQKEAAKQRLTSIEAKEKRQIVESGVMF